MKNKGFIFLIIAMIVLLTSCPGIGSDDGSSGSSGGGSGSSVGSSGGGNTTRINPPTNVTADTESKVITIYWNAVDGAIGYRIYRKVGNGEFAEIPDSYTTNTNFTYTEYSHDVDIYYAVKSVASSEESSLSDGSNVIHLSFEDVMKALQPTVRSFSTANNIIIEWDADPNADSYILYRDENHNGTYSDEVYSGSALSFSDNNVMNGQFYYYKLALVNSGTTYDKSEYAFGVASSKSADEYEENDDIGDSTILELNSINTANIYYYEDSQENILIDYDWYHVNVPANRDIPVFFEDFDGINDGDIYFMIEGASPVAVNEFDGFLLSNSSNEETQIKFKVHVDMTAFFNKFGSYKIIIGQ